jgi:hypothetical protein
MKPFKLSLTAQGLKTIFFGSPNAPFDFIVGDETHTIPSFVADFLSPKIAALRKAEPGLDYYELGTSVPEKIFPLFLSLGRGEDIEVTQANLIYIALIAEELQNREIRDILAQRLPQGAKGEDVYARVQFVEACGEDATTELDYISTHWSEIPPAVTELISTAHMAKIAAHQGFTVKDPDKFFEFLIARITNDPANITLLEFIDFTSLNEASMKKFVEIGTAHLESLNPRIWEKIFERLKQAVNPPANRNRSVK